MKDIKEKFECYDWDDNILFMPTNIILFHKKSNLEISMTTENFAHYRSFIGKNKIFFSNQNGLFSEDKTQNKFNFKDFEIRGDDHGKSSSFREFRDCKNKYFLKHLEEAIQNKQFAPEWDSFLKSLNQNKKQANKTYIITARGHSPETIYEGLKFLQKKKIIKYLIPKKNIYPVSYLNADNAYGPQEFKFRIFKDIIIKANDNNDSLVYFSDDDHKTYNHIKESVINLTHDFSNKVKVMLRYTGTKDLKGSNIFQKIFS